MRWSSEEIQRWTAKRRVTLIVSIVKAETSAAEAARKHGLTVAEIACRHSDLTRSKKSSLRAGAFDQYERWFPIEQA